MTTPTSPFATASSALPVGTRLGEFEITGVIGEGGFGIVYSAHDSSLDRIVAVKEYLPSAFCARSAQGLVQVKTEENRNTFAAGLSSFINEAKMLAKFSHPGLVEVFRFWEANGTAYMAMRYYRGVTLRELLRNTPQVVTEQWLCETLDPILLALKELHSEKCYHRDIAPDNILVLPNGRSVLMDFGAARRIIGGMTQALTVVLKPGYAPIEQYYDDGSMEQGSWTDIYAVGGLLYHLMTGKVPVQAISRMMSDPLKPVAELARGSFSPQLCNVVMKCLAVLPDKRYQTIDELRDALGWVIMPVVSTVVHAPKPPETDDYPATVILQDYLDPDSTLGAALRQPSQPSNVQKSAPAPEFDPDATMVAPIIAPPTAPTAPPAPPTAAVAAPVHKPEPALKPEPAPVSKPAPAAPKSKPRPPEPVFPPEGVKTVSTKTIGIALASIMALVLVVAGYFVFSKSSSEQEAGVAANTPAPVTNAASAVEAAPAPAQVAAERASAPLANNAAINPQPTPPVEAVPPTPVSTAVSPAPVAVAAAPVVTAPVVTAPVPAPVANAKPAAPTVTTGTVHFELKDGWGMVYVDGQSKGTAPPLVNLKLPAGTHEIELRNPAMATVKRSVEVVAGKTVVVRHAFTK